MNPSFAPSFTQLCPGTEQEVLDEFQDFEDGRWEGWTNGKSEQSNSNFTMFLGRYAQGDSFPYKEYQIPDLSTVRFFFEFDFYEIGSWDGDSNSEFDSVGIKITGDFEETVSLGWFKNFATASRFNENGGSGTSSLGVEWSFTSTSASDSPQGFKDDTNPHWDQKHKYLIEIPRTFYANSRSLTITVQWNLSGNIDESLGIDNVRTVSCIDLVPSVTPSWMPSTEPSESPTNPPVPAPRPTGPSGPTRSTCAGQSCCPGELECSCGSACVDNTCL